MLKHKTKIANFLLIATCTLLPLNATAINRASAFNNFLGSLFSGDVPQTHSEGNIAESLLLKSLLEIRKGDTKQALATINQLISEVPNFKLAYLIQGDLFTAQAKQLQNFGDMSPTENSANIIDLRDEARARIEHYLSENKLHKTPNLFIQPDNSQHHVILVDALKSRLYLYENNNGQLTYVSDYYVTIGKNGAGKKNAGDKRTPLGVYFASKGLKSQLADIYGDAAFPLSYPNELDLHQNKTGSGIWLHGTPHDTYSRPPHASDGCVVLSNSDLKMLQSILQQGDTPVIISDQLTWGDADNATEEQNKLKDAIEAWRKDWESQNTSEYLSHYSSDFFSPDGDYQYWAAYKTKIQAAKPKVEINLSKISMFEYPDNTQKLAVVNFDQDFKATNLKNTMRKRQYWVYENKNWKIIYEGKA